MAIITRQLLHLQCTQPPTPTFSPSLRIGSITCPNTTPSSTKLLIRASYKHTHTGGTHITVKATSASDGIVASDDDGEGVSLGTMKLPPNTDIPRFETLLFQWANSLCQGANLPLPVPLKVDKIQGGARLGFISIDDGKTEVSVYIDCLVSPASKTSVPLFRAIRNGRMKDTAPPGEPRIMRSLLQALQKSAQLARV